MTGSQKPLVKIQRAELVNFKRAPTDQPKEELSGIANEKDFIRHATAWWIKSVELNRWIQSEVLWSL